VLFQLGHYSIEAEGTLYLLAALLAGIWAIRLCRREGWDPNAVVPGLLLTLVASYAGARLSAATLERGALPPNPLAELLHPSAGLSFFGGLALGSLTILGYLRWKRLPLGRVTDGLAPLAPILYAMFRLGCFLKGDDYGPPTALPWAMRFPHGSPPATQPVHPTQLYEILLMVPVFAWLRARRTAGLPAGALAFELCMLMGSERFLAEFWRLDPYRAGGLSLSQWLALLLLILGIVGRRLTISRSAKRAQAVMAIARTPPTSLTSPTSPART